MTRQGKKDSAIGKSIHKMTICATRPCPSSNNNENVDLTRHPQKRCKTSNGSKKMEASGKDHAVLGGKVF